MHNHDVNDAWSPGQPKHHGAAGAHVAVDGADIVQRDAISAKQAAMHDQHLHRASMSAGTSPMDGGTSPMDDELDSAKYG